MRNEDDLRAALSTRERLAPDPGPVLAGIHDAARNLRRRRILTSSAATATCVAGAVAVVMAVPSLLAPTSPPMPPTPEVVQPAALATTDAHAADRPDFFFTIEPTTVAGYEIRPSGVSPTGQGALVARAPGGDVVGGVSLERPGSMTDAPAFSPNSQVHGEPAWFEKDSDRGIGFLYWEYAPDSMAVVSLRRPDAPLSDYLAIAEAITFVDPYPARLPLRLDELPPDLRPIALNLGELGARAALFFANDIGDVEPEAAHPREVTIRLLDRRPAAGEAPWLGYEELPWESPTVIGAHDVRCAQAPAGLNFDDARTCEIEVPGGVVIIDFFELTPAEIEQLIAGLAVADPTDPTTWFSSVDALP